MMLTGSRLILRLKLYQEDRPISEPPPFSCSSALNTSHTISVSMAHYHSMNEMTLTALNTGPVHFAERTAYNNFGMAYNADSHIM